MSDKNKITSEVALKLSTFLSAEDVAKATFIMETALEDYTLTENSYEVGTEFDDNEKYFSIFVASRRLEGLSECTIRHYVYESRRMLDFLDKNFRDVTAIDCSYYLSMYAKKGVSRRSLDNMRRHLSGYFRWLKFNDYIENNPLEKVAKISYEKKEIQILSDEEIIKMRDYLSNTKNKYCIRLRAIVEVLLSTGVRVSELIRIGIDDIDMQSGEVLIHSAKKRGKEKRRIFLSTEARYYINQYMEYRIKRGWNNSNALFQANKSNGKPLTERDYNVMLAKLGEDIGIRGKKVTVHLFRKTLASRLYRRGMAPVDIAYILGHADTRTSEAYYIHIDVATIKRNFENLY